MSFKRKYKIEDFLLGKGVCLKDFDMPGHHRYKPILSLVILLLLIMVTSSKGFLGFEPKLPGVMEPSSVTLVEGSTLAFNCTLTTYSTTPLGSEAIYFTSFYNGVLSRVNDTYYHIRDPKTVELIIPDVKREDGSTFKCNIADSQITGGYDTVIAQATADIGVAPYPIDISVISDNWNNMTVNWCPEVFQQDPVTYTMFWEIENSNHSGNCSTWSSNRNCYCIFCSSPTSGVCDGKGQTFYALQNYKINITAYNTYGTTSAYLEVYTSTEIVKPGPVTDLKVDSCTSRQLTVSWENPLDVSFPLIFQINASSEWESFLFDVGNNTSWTLENLTPYTNYTIVVRCKPVEEGYWSDSSSVSKATLEEAPAVAPNVPIGFFRLSSCSTDKCNVAVFWQLIDEKLQNGVILGYRLLVKSANCSPCQEVFVPGDATSSVVSFASGSDNWVEISANTSAGYSPSQYIYFPSYFTSLPNVISQDLYAEYSSNRKEIYFSWNYVEDVDNYTFMYCEGIQDDPNSCRNSVDISFPNHQTNYTFANFQANYVYSLSANYKNGTNGLTTQWLCIYDYSGVPSAPNLHGFVQLSETSVQVSWDALQCSTVNRVRVLQYVIHYHSADLKSGFNVTLPGNVTEYVITDLVPKTDYELLLFAVSRSDPGPSASQKFHTTVPVKVDVVTPVVVTISVVVVIVIIIISIVCYRRSRKWLYGIDIKTPETLKPVSEDSLKDSSAGIDPYLTFTMNSDGQNVLPSSSASCDLLEVQTDSSESQESGPSSASTETSIVFENENSESIQTYTAAGFNEEMLSESSAPGYSQAKDLADWQINYENSPQSTSSGPNSEQCASSGYSRGKFPDKFDAEVSNYHASHKFSGSVSSLDTSDGYTEAKLQDCVPDIVGPPVEPSLMLE